MLLDPTLTSGRRASILSTYSYTAANAQDGGDGAGAAPRTQVAACRPTVDSAEGTGHLLEAIDSGQWLEVRTILRDLRVNPNFADPATGRLPLHAAARRGDVRAMQELLDYGAQLDGVDASGRGTALHMAVRGTGPATAVVAAVRLLLDRGADPNREDAHGRTALWYAAWYADNLDVIDVLSMARPRQRSGSIGGIDSTSRCRGSGGTGGSYTIRNRATSTSSIASISTATSSAIANTAVTPNPPITPTSTTSGTIIAATPNSPTTPTDRSSTAHGPLTADPSVIDYECSDRSMPTALWAAVESTHPGAPAAARLLLDRGARPDAVRNRRDSTLLHQAAGTADARRAAALAPLLLAGGADVHARDGMNRLPLHRAAMAAASTPAEAEHRRAVIESLLEHEARLAREGGADAPSTDSLSGRDTNGATPLILAARAGSLPVVRRLGTAWMARMEQGYRGDDGGWAARDNGGNGPLHHAAASDNVLVVAYLLGMGADINERNGEGHTPLDISINSGRAAITDMLLMLGASQGRQSTSR